MISCSLASLTTEGLQVTQTICGRLHTFSGGRIEQQARLVAALGNAIPSKIQIRQNHRGGRIPFSHGFPKQLDGLLAVASSTLIAIQIFFRGSKIFGAARLSRRTSGTSTDWERPRCR